MVNERRKAYLIAGDKVSAHKTPFSTRKPRGERVVFDKQFLKRLVQTRST